MKYQRRDTEALAEHYLAHLDAMTREGLHDKSAIAAELAWRDARIAKLEERIGEMESACPNIHEMVLRENKETNEQSNLHDPQREARHDRLRRIRLAQVWLG